MNYEKHYALLCSTRQARGLDKSSLIGYYELHHIKPRSQGGSDKPENLVLLTAKEHCLAHLLRYKAFGHYYDALACIFVFSDGKAKGRRLSYSALAIAKNKHLAEINKQLEQRKHNFLLPEARKNNAKAVSASLKKAWANGTHPLSTPEAKLKATKRLLQLIEEGKMHTKEANAKRSKSCTIKMRADKKEDDYRRCQLIANTTHKLSKLLYKQFSWHCSFRSAECMFYNAKSGLSWQEYKTGITPKVND